MMESMVRYLVEEQIQMPFEEDRLRLMERICRNLVDWRGCHRAWVALLDESGEVASQIASSESKKDFDPMRLRLNQGEFPYCLEQVRAGRGDFVISGADGKCGDCPWADGSDDSVCVVFPLIIENKVYGNLTATVPVRFAETPEKRRAIEELKENLVLFFRILDAGNISLQSEVFMRRILENTESIIFLQDRKGRYLYYNGSPSYGLAAEDVVGKTPADFFDAETAALFKSRLDTVVDTGKRLTTETRVVWNGKPIWFMEEYNPLLDVKGKVAAVSCFSQNITERVLADQNRIESEAQKQAILDGISAEIFFVNTDLEIRWINKSLANATEKKVDQMIGQKCYRVFNRRHDPCLECNALKAMSTRWSQEAVVTTRDNRTWNKRSEPVFDNDGILLGAVVILQDITHQYRTEEALKDSEARLRSILDNMPVMLDAFDEKDHLVAWNKECERVTGYQADDVIGNPQILEWLYPDADYRRMVMAKMDEVGRNFRNLELELTCRDGSRKTILWSNLSDLYPIPGWHQWAIGFDVTDWKKAETALQSSEEKFRQLFEQAPESILVAELDGTILDFNHRFSLTGYPREQIVGWNIFEFREFKHVNPYREIFPRVTKGQMEPMEIETTTREGEKIWVNAYPSILEEGGKKRFRFMFQDITHRKAAEQALKDANDRYSALFERSQDAIYISDLQGRILDANPAALKMLGFEKPDMIHMSFASIMDPKQFEKASQTMKEIIETGTQSRPVQYLLKRRDGSQVWVEANSTLICRDGRPAAIQGIARDISQRMEAEQQLRFAKGQAEATAGAKTQFLANMSHEIRTPMQAIQGFAKLGISRIDIAKKKKLSTYFQEIYTGSERLMSLLNKVLDLSRLEAGKTEYRFERDRFSTMISVIIKEFMGICQEKRVHVGFDIPDFDDRVDMDRFKVMQVIRNLLSNAIAWSRPGGHVLIMLTPMPGLMRVSVMDSGTGIPEDELETIFDKFTQSRQNWSGSGGTGLGLAICREIIKGHRGDIWAENNDVGGATFHFTLPIVQGEAETPVQPEDNNGFGHA